MPLINWNDYFVTGIKIVDEQHRHLVALINESAPVLALSFKSNPDKAGELLDALTEYAVYHFKTEDELIRQAGIDQRHYEHHPGIHGNFAATITSMRKLYEQGEKVTGGELLGFLANWLIFHILGEDRHMAWQLRAIQAGKTPAEAYDSATDDQNNPANSLLTQALLDLFALMTKQNQHLLEMNQELQAHREHLEDLVAQRTIDLEAARISAETANRAKSALISNLSHEIRTPMNAIVGLTWTLQEESRDTAQKSKLEQVSNSTQQLLCIINDLIDISRIESAQLALEPLDFDLRQIIDHLVANHAGKARQKGLSFVTKLPENVPALLHGDPVRIAQIISNLTSNAIKFTVTGGIEICINLKQGSQLENVLLEVDVVDSGIGISPDESALLFEPFEQLDQSTRRRFGGTGLGLAISQRLAGMMGGHVSVRSDIGKGSVFSLKIPLTAASHAVSSHNTSSSQRSFPKDTQLEWAVIEAALLGLNRLLAEDDIQAISLWREHEDQLKAAFRCQAKQLENDLGQYNFESALNITQELLSSLPEKKLS